ncbi:MAG: glutathione synthase [Lysobacterales bacterium]
MHPLRIAWLTDPLASIRPGKDSTVAMMRAAQARGHQLFQASAASLTLQPGSAGARWTALRVNDDDPSWYAVGAEQHQPLDAFDVLMLRRDPPVDGDFLADTLWASLGEGSKPLVVNAPQALRDCNEKLFALAFPQCCAETFVAREAAAIKRFVTSIGECVLKPLDGMAGRSIFRSAPDDPNLNVILETLTDNGRHFVMAQRFLPEIAEGDKRILMIDGEPVPFSLARIPQGGDFRANLARGGRGNAQPLSARDRWIAAEVGPELRRRGLLFVGLDVIGDYLTEINVTSPTGIRDIDSQAGTRIGDQLFAAIERRLT